MMFRPFIGMNGFLFTRTLALAAAWLIEASVEGALANGGMGAHLKTLNDELPQGVLQRADHTPYCKPGSRHPGGAADQAARAQQKRQSETRTTRDPAKLKEPVANRQPTPKQIGPQPQTAPAPQEGTIQQATTQDQAIPPVDEKPLASVRAEDGKFWDYSYLRAEISENFKQGYGYVSETLKEDLFAVQFFHSKKRLGRGEGNRTLAWWIPATDSIVNLEGEVSTSVLDEELKKSLSSKPPWGDRDRMAIVRIPKGTTVEFVKGERIDQTAYPGSGVHMLFLQFSKKWIVRTLKVPNGPLASLISAGRRLQ